MKMEESTPEYKNRIIEITIDEFQNEIDDLQKEISNKTVTMNALHRRIVVLKTLLIPIHKVRI